MRWAEGLHGDVVSIGSRGGDGSALLPQFIEVKFDRFANIAVHLGACSAYAYTTGEVGDVGGIAPLRSFR